MGIPKAFRFPQPCSSTRTHKLLSEGDMQLLPAKVYCARSASAFAPALLPVCMVARAPLCAPSKFPF